MRDGSTWKGRPTAAGGGRRTPSVWRCRAGLLPLDYLNCNCICPLSMGWKVSYPGHVSTCTASPQARTSGPFRPACSTINCPAVSTQAASRWLTHIRHLAWFNWGTGDQFRDDRHLSGSQTARPQRRNLKSLPSRHHRRPVQCRASHTSRPSIMWGKVVRRWSHGKHGRTGNGQRQRTKEEAHISTIFEATRPVPSFAGGC